MAMRYTTDDMRNYAGPSDPVSDALGGACVAMREAADEIDRLRTALEIIARDPGGVPAPRLFARDVLDGNIVLHANAAPNHT